MFAREPEAVAVARCQQLRLAVSSAPPDRPDSVDHMLRRQPVAARDPRFTRWTSPDRAALLEQLRTRCAMNRAIDPASAEQRFVRSVDDGIDRESRDVCLNESQEDRKTGRQRAIGRVIRTTFLSSRLPVFLTSQQCRTHASSPAAPRGAHRAGSPASPRVPQSPSASRGERCC